MVCRLCILLHVKPLGKFIRAIHLFAFQYSDAFGGIAMLVNAFK